MRRTKRLQETRHSYSGGCNALDISTIDGPRFHTEGVEVAWIAVGATLLQHSNHLRRKALKAEK